MADVVLYRNPDGQVVRLTSDSFNVTYEDSFIDITIDAPRSTDQVGLWYEVNTSDFYQPLNYSLRLNLDSNQITTVTLQSATASSYQNALDGAWETINKTFNLRIYRPTNPVVTLPDSDFVEDIIVDSDNILYSEEIEITGNELEIQELLVSGVNIKTINAQSLLGSGNLVISGGGGGSGVGTLDSLSDVNITGITENQFIKFNSVSETFEPISIKTINNNSLLGSGDISITADLSNISFSTIINTPTTIAGYGITDAFDGQYSSLSGAPTNVSSFTNDAGYITSLTTLSFTNITDKPTTISGYGITDAFNGQYSSLSGIPSTFTPSAHNQDWTTITGIPSTFPPSSHTQAFSTITSTPTTIAGYGITDAFDGQYSSLSGIPSTFTPSTHNHDWNTITDTPTTIDSYGITDAFDGAFSSLTGTPTTLSGYGITDSIVLSDNTIGAQPVRQYYANQSSFPNATDWHGAIAHSHSDGAMYFAHGGTWIKLANYATTISGYGITDAFDGAFSSLTGTPTTIAGYGITDAFDGAFSSLTGTPTTIAGYGITDAFNGAFSSLTGTPTTLSGYGITDALNINSTIRDLSDIYDTDPANGQVLKWDSDNNRWSPSPDIATIGAVGFSADLLDSQEGTYYLDYNNFTNTPTIPTNTTQISEGSNLYYTDARVDSRVLNTLLIDEDDMSSNSATRLPSQQSVKAYVDNEVAAVVDAAPEQLNTLNELAAAINDDSNFAVNITTLVGTKLSTSDFNTTFDNRLATKSTSNLSEGSNLYYTTLRSDSDFDVRLNTKSTDDLSEGSNLYYTDARFDTRFGTKSTSDISEGSNLYYTDARFDTRFGTKSTSDISEGSNLYYTTSRSDSDFDVRLGIKSTTDLSEGSNLYYTDARFDSRLAAKSTDDLSEGSNLYYTTDRVDSDFDVKLGTISTNDVTEGSNLYYTDARFDTRFNTKTTSNLSEGSNLYYTDARFDTRFNTKTTSNLSEGSNLYYTTDRVDSDFNISFAAKTADSLSEGLINFYYTDAKVDSRIGLSVLSDLSNVASNVASANEYLKYNGSLYVPSPIEFQYLTGTPTTISGYGITDAFDGQYSSLTGIPTEFTADLSNKTTDDLSEGSTNLYYTNTRADARINLQTGVNLDLSSKTTSDLAEGTNLYYTQSRFNAAFTSKSTSDLSEGTNLYFTDARADARINNALAGDITIGGNLTVSGTSTTINTQTLNVGDNIIVLNADETGSPTQNAGIEVERGTATNVALRYNESINKWQFTNDGSNYNDLGSLVGTTDDVTEGSTNLYYTNSRFDTRLGTKTTDDVTEGSTNLYYTDARVDARINLQTGTNIDLSSKSTDDLSEGSTNLYYTDTRFDSRFNLKSTTNLSEGTNLYYTDGRADARINLQTGVNLDLSNKTTSDLVEGTNLYYTQSRFDTAFDTRLGLKSTTNLSEGTNLYFTNARADARINNALAGDIIIGGNLTVSGTTTTINTQTLNIGDNVITLNADETGTPSQNAGIEVERGTSTNVVLRYNEGSDKWEFTNDGTNFTELGTISGTTDDVSEGSTNLYYTDARFDTRFGTKSTSDLSEGTNLYYTDTRFDTRLGTKSTSDISEGSNLYYTDTRVDARINSTLSGDITIGGDLTVSGTTTTAVNIEASQITADDFVVDQAGRIYFQDTSSVQKARIGLHQGLRLYAGSTGTNSNAYMRFNGEGSTPVIEPAAAAGATVGTSETIDFGGSSNRWKDIYAKNIDVSTNITVNGFDVLTENSDIGSLSNVDTSAAADTYVLTYDASTSTWIAAGTSSTYGTTNFNTDFATKTTTDLTEGTNLYYTDARVDTRINLQTGTNLNLSNKSTDDLSEGSSNLYYTDTRFDNRLATKSTSNLSEGTNLYYTDGRADARINLQTGTNLDLSNKSTSDLSEGTNLYYTDARVQTKLGNLSGHILPSADQTYDLGSSNYRFRELWLSGSTLRIGSLSLKDSNGGFVVVSGGVSQTIATNETLSNLVTDDVTEGSTNLYYTQSRFDTAFTAKSTSDLSEGTNLYYTDTRFDTRLATKSTDDVTEGSNLYYTDARADARINNTLSGDVVIGGNLTVSGTTTQVNSNTVNIGDNILVLNADETGAPSQNAGIEIQRGTSANVVFRYNEGTDKWEFTNDGSTFTNLGSTELLDDTSPQLGGTLDANGNDIDMGVNTITDTKVGQWDTAYGWGDHASTGYLTDISAQNLTTLTDVDAVTSSDDGKILFYDHGTTSFKWKDEATSGVTAFTSLTDGPGAYTGNSGKYVKVNSAQNGLEYTELSTDVTAIVDTAYVNARVTRQSFDFGSIISPAAFTLDLGSIV